jgi:perosamine synthetase
MVQRDKVGATVYYDPPVHRTPYYERMWASETNSSMLPRSDLGNTDWASEHVLSLPIHPLVTQQELARIAHSLKGAL